MFYFLNHLNLGEASHPERGDIGPVPEDHHHVIHQSGMRIAAGPL